MIEPHDILIKLLKRPLLINRISQSIRIQILLLRKWLKSRPKRLLNHKTVRQRNRLLILLLTFLFLQYIYLLFFCFGYGKCAAALCVSVSQSLLIHGLLPLQLILISKYVMDQEINFSVHKILLHHIKLKCCCIILREDFLAWELNLCYWMDENFIAFEVLGLEFFKLTAAVVVSTLLRWLLIRQYQKWLLKLFLKLFKRLHLKKNKLINKLSPLIPIKLLCFLHLFINFRQKVNNHTFSLDFLLQFLWWSYELGCELLAVNTPFVLNLIKILQIRLAPIYIIEKTMKQFVLDIWARTIVKSFDNCSI